jgi:hypothetical protein
MGLGNQAEFLGVMGMSEMLAMFFTHDGGDTSKWRLKGHGERKFWEWMATWAVTITKPSDLGFSDEGYDLPPLNMHEHMVASPVSEDSLLVDIAQTLTERRAAKNATVEARVAEVAKLCNGNDDQWLVWCHTNNESELLKKAIDGAVEVKGSDSIDHKESAMEGFTAGDVRVLVSKPSICGFGMNWQHCHDMAFVGLDDSYEQMYQAIRRCWRFGQDQPVNVHIVSAEALGAIRANIQRKERQMEQMQLSMVDHMRDAMQKEIKGASMIKDDYERQVYEEATDTGVTASQLKSAIAQVAHALPTKDVRPMLNGVHLCEGYAVATDGLKLAHCDLGYTGKPIIIPAETVRQMPDIDGQVSVSDRQIIINGERHRYTSNLIEQKYPDWPRFIPQDFKWECTINADDLADAIKTAQIGGDSVRVDAKDGEILIHNDKAEAAVSESFDGELKAAFFAQYLIDAIGATGSDSVKLQVGAGRGEALINGQFLVMPVKL